MRSAHDVSVVSKIKRVTDTKSTPYIVSIRLSTKTHACPLGYQSRVADDIS